MMLRRIFSLLVLLVLVAAIALWAAIPHPRSAVDWSEHPAVVLQSDDWGFCAWLPDSTAQAELGPRVDGWGYGRSPYRGSTLESAADVDRMVEILGSVRGGDGRPALLQPNYVVGAPDFEAIERSGFTRYVDRPLADDLPGWERPGLMDAIERAREAGVWVPEYHGSSHGNVEAFLELLRGEDPETREMFDRRVLVNDEHHDDYECDPVLSVESRRRRLERGWTLFEELFGRPPFSVIASNYCWDESQEDLWAEFGVGVVQGWRQQRRSIEGVDGRARRWRKLARPMGRYDDERELLFLYRNAFFEPSERPWVEPEAIAAESLRGIVHAWSKGRPAVVCTHRMNFARLSQEESEHGRRALRALLEGIVRADPRVVFLCDHELRQLYREGVSQMRVAPDEIRLRNYTEQTRELRVELPEGWDFVEMVGEGEARVEGDVVLLVLEPGDHTVRLQ